MLLSCYFDTHMHLLHHKSGCNIQKNMSRISDLQNTSASTIEYGIFFICCSRMMTNTHDSLMMTFVYP